MLLGNKSIFVTVNSYHNASLLLNGNSVNAFLPKSLYLFHGENKDNIYHRKFVMGNIALVLLIAEAPLASRYYLFNGVRRG